MLCGGHDGSPGAHRVADHDGRPAECGDEGGDIASGGVVAVAGEGGVAVAVPAQIGGGHAVAGCHQRRSQEAVGRAQIGHARNQHNQRSVAVHVIGDSAAVTLKEAGARRGGVVSFIWLT